MEGNTYLAYKLYILLIWVIICYRSHLLREPETTIGDTFRSHWMHTSWIPLNGSKYQLPERSVEISPVGRLGLLLLSHPHQAGGAFCVRVQWRFLRFQKMNANNNKKHICSVLRVGGQTLAGGQWKMMGCWVYGVNCDWIPWVFPYTSKYPLMFGVLGMFWGSSHTEPQKVWMSRVLQLRTWRHAMMVATKFGSTIFGWASCESLGGWYIHRIH